VRGCGLGEGPGEGEGALAWLGSRRREALSERVVYSSSAAIDGSVGASGSERFQPCSRMHEARRDQTHETAHARIEDADVSKAREFSATAARKGSSKAGAVVARVRWMASRAPCSTGPALGTGIGTGIGIGRGRGRGRGRG
jgi:hypothetical protein